MEVLNTKDKVREEGRVTPEQLLKKIVPVPEDVKVNCETGERTTIYKVSCSQANIGHVIGSRGRTIDSLRVIISAQCAREGIRAIIEIPFFKRD